MSRGQWGDVIDIGGGRLPPFPKPPTGTVKAVLAVLAALVLLFTSYYQVEPDEVGVVQRFGAFVRTTDPGPHLKLPFGIERVTKVPVLRQLKMEFGFRTVASDVRSEFATPLEAADESVMLTGDLNVAIV
jgi:membrane protease subunit HflK